MVLSNKKLKQKLRSLLAQSLATSESAGRDPNNALDKEAVAQELRSLKEAVSNRRNQRSRPPRKRKRKEEEEEKKNAGDTHEKKVEDTEEGGGGERNEKKKRKREETVGVIEGEEEKGSSKKNKKKRKEKEKRKKKKRKKEKKRKDGSLKEGEEEDKPKEELGASEREESGDAAKKVYVGGIPYYSTEEDIISFFEGCGTVTEVDCMKFPESGKFRGIAILTFKTEAAAKRASALDGADMGGFYLKIQPYRPTTPSVKADKADFAPEMVEGYNRIYVGNLSWEITEDELRDFFAGCCISSIRLGEDKTTGEFKGYAHIDFLDKESLTTALKLDQNVVCRRPVRIRCAVPLQKSSNGSMSYTSDSKGPETDSRPAQGKKKTKKRRTCYNCGVPGHLSSACPQKKNDGANDGK